MINTNDLQRLVQANLEELEQVRLQQQEEFAVLRSRYFRSVGTIVLLVFLGAGLLFNSGAGAPFLVLGLIISVALSIIAAVMYHKKTGAPKQALKNRVKEEIYQKAVTHWYPQMTYHPKQHIPEATYKAADLFGNYDIYDGDDYIKGNLPTGQALSFSELDVKSEDRDGNNNHSVSIVFKGLFFALELPTAVHSTVKILPDVAERGMGKLGVFLQGKLGKLGHGKSKLVYFEEHPAFEKEFVVYSQDEAIARQIITPTLVQTLLQLRELTQGIAVSFSGNQLYLAASAKKDFLGVDTSIALTAPNLLNKLVEDLDYALQLMNCLEELSRFETEGGQGQIIPPTTQKQKTPKAPQKSSVNYKKSKSKDNPFLL
ncbi:MAG: DUF3137 domain-containing protein [Aureispira sp.]